MLSTEEKNAIIKDYATHDGDTGSPEVQVAILTHRINTLSQHMRANKHDFASQRGLLKMVGKRRSQLDYLMKIDRSRYEKLIERLGLRK